MLAFILSVFICCSVNAQIGLVDPLLQNKLVVESLRERRYLDLSDKDKEMILLMHNKYRSSVAPPAANMRLMIWDAVAEQSAKRWADNCVFDHGMPPGYESMGQNLYKGPEGTGKRASFLWWNETVVYDFWTSTCVPGEQCGHYTQMAWANSYLLGCGVSDCGDWNLVVCHYRPPGNVQHEFPYKVGLPCSQCETGYGGHCYKNLCVTQSQCQSLSLNCSCSLKCRNCGILNKNECNCQCKNGWDSLDCSRKCEDKHSACRKSPGFPTKYSCARDPRIAKELCRSMCDQCEVLPNSSFPKYFFDPDITGESGKKYNICCNGELCTEGHVLNEDYCACQLLCPGPRCGQKNIKIDFLVHLLAMLLLILCFDIK